MACVCVCVCVCPPLVNIPTQVERGIFYRLVNLLTFTGKVQYALSPPQAHCPSLLRLTQQNIPDQRLTQQMFILQF